MSTSDKFVQKTQIEYSTSTVSEQTVLKSLSSYLSSIPFSISDCTTRITSLQQASEVSCLSISASFIHFAAGVGNSLNVYLYQDNSLYFSHSHDSSVNAVAFSPDSRFVASGSSDKTVKVFKLDKRAVEHEFSGHSNSVQSVMFNRSSHLVVSGSSDNSIIIWNLYTNSVECKLLGHTSAVNAVCFDSESEIVASASNCIKIWSVEQQKELFTLVNDFNFYFCLAISPNNQYVAGGNSQNTLIVWNLFTKLEEMRFTSFQSFVFSICYTFDGNYIISGSADSSVKVWNIKEKREELQLLSHKNQVFAVQVSPDGKKIFSGSKDGELNICDLQENCEKVEKVRSNFYTYKLKTSPSGKFLVLLTNDRNFRLWSVVLETFVYSCGMKWSTTHCFEVSQNEKWIAFGTSDKEVKVFSFLEGKLEAVLEGHKDSVKSVFISFDEKWVVSGSCDRTVRVWDLEQRKEAFCLEGHLEEVNAVLFTPDNLKIVSGSGDKTIKIWDFNSKSLFFELLGHQEPVGRLFMCSNPDKFVSVSADNSIRVWNLEFKREEFCIKLDKSAQDVSFDKNSDFLATCNENIINIWNLSEKRLEFSISEPLGGLRSLSFDNEGKYLFVSFENRKLYQYKLKSNKINSEIIDEFSYDYSKLAKYSEETVTLQSTLNKSEKVKIPVLGKIKYLDISPDSQHIVIISHDGLIKLLSVPEQTLKIEFKDFPSPLWSAFFTENSNLALINSDNGLTKLFSLTALSEIPLKSEKIIKKNSLALASLFESGFCPSLTYFNFLYCISTNQYSKLSPPSLDFSFTNLNFSGLHILSALSQTEVLMTLSKSYNFTLRSDLYGKSPINYSIKLYDQKTTDFLLNYLISTVEKSLSHIYQPSFYALRNDLTAIIMNSSYYLHSFLGVCLLSKGNHFGIPLNDLPSIKAMESGGSVFEDFAVDGELEDFRPLEFQVSLFPIQAAAGSAGSLELLKSLLICSNYEIFQTDFIQALIQSSWTRSLIYIYAFTLLIWGNLVVLVLLIDPKFCSLPLIAVFVACNFILLIWEMVQFKEATISYFFDIWNFVDIFRLGLSFTFAGLLFMGYSHPYLSWVTLALNVLRGLTGFRAFNATRYYIGLIFNSISKVLSFLFIFVYSNLSFGILLAVSSNNTEFSFESIWIDIFNLDLGELGVLEDRQVSLNYLTFLLACVINVILMLNMLISILGDSYDEFQSQAEFYNYTEMAEVIIEVEQIKNFFSSPDKFYYLHVCYPAHRKLDDTWKGKVVDFRRHIEELKTSIAKGFEKSAETSESQQTQAKNDQANMKSALKQIESALMSNLQPQFSLMNQRMASIEQALSALSTKLDQVS